MALHFRGMAHPPPAARRHETADLSAGEICCTHMGRGHGTTVLYEHDATRPVGTVLASWEGNDGSLRVAGCINDTDTIKQIRGGELRGLSLGTAVTTDVADNTTLFREQVELSVCEEPRRAGCYIDTIDGKTVRRVACASAHGSVRTVAVLIHGCQR